MKVLRNILRTFVHFSVYPLESDGAGFLKKSCSVFFRPKGLTNKPKMSFITFYEKSTCGIYLIFFHEVTVT